MIARSLLLAVSMAVCVESLAQTPAPDAASPPPAAVPTRMVGDGPPSRQDPRVCLEFPTREQVIACAEKYRPRRSAAKA